MRFGAIANSARGEPQRPPPMGDRVNFFAYFQSSTTFNNLIKFNIYFSSDLQSFKPRNIGDYLQNLAVSIEYCQAQPSSIQLQLQLVGLR